MIILGIDIGSRGAVAALNENGELINVWSMPCLEHGPKRRRTINAPLFAEMIYESHAMYAFVERVGPRPTDGTVGAFAFGDSNGVVRGALAAAAIPMRLITPTQWKRAVGIPPGKSGAKDAARAEAIRRWPAMAGHFRLVKDDGKAEAALIAVAGIAIERGRINAGDSSHQEKAL